MKPPCNTCIVSVCFCIKSLCHILYMCSHCTLEIKFILYQHIHVSMVWNCLYVYVCHQRVWNYIFIVNLYTNLKVITVSCTHFSTLPRQPITQALIMKPIKWHAGKLYKNWCGEACMVVSKLFFHWFQHWAFSHCEDSEPQKKTCARVIIWSTNPSN